MKHTLRLAVLAACAALVPGCAGTLVSPVGFGTLPSGYTCCNLHHADDWISDANWGTFPMIPAGAPIKVVGYGSNRAFVEISGMQFRIGHDYGRGQETLEQYVAKIVVKEDPRARIAAWPEPVREAMRLGRLLPGMTREQAIVSAGYPATHRTPILEAPVWTYWHDRLSSYRVTWNGEGRIEHVSTHQ
jgi:hypothetical protein